MYCPECGKELSAGARKCEHCGAELRRVLREEYLSKQEAREESERTGEKFRLPPEESVSDIGWRNLHKERQPAIIWTAIGVVGLVLLGGLLYIAFTPVKSRKSESTYQAPAANSAEAEKPQAPAVKPPSPEPSETPAAPSEPPPSQPRPAETNQVAVAPQGAPITTEEVSVFVNNWITEWEKSVKTKEIEPLAAYYSGSFKSSTGKDKEKWMDARLKIARITNYLNITAEDMKINIDKHNRANVQYMQTYFSDTYSDKGVKSLVVIRESEGLKIISEGFENRTPAAEVSIPKVKATVLEWRNAWENIAIAKKLGDLPSFYHPDFKGPAGQGKKGWLDLKMRVADKFTIIAVDIRDIHASVLGSRAIASFTQVFKSDKYADEGTKVLIFKVKDGKPLIINEFFYMRQRVNPLKVNDFWGP